jgi:hypothetical protein
MTAHGAPNMPIIYGGRITINLSRSEYPIIEEVAKELGWRISREENF